MLKNRRFPLTLLTNCLTLLQLKIAVLSIVGFAQPVLPNLMAPPHLPGHQFLVPECYLDLLELIDLEVR